MNSQEKSKKKKIKVLLVDDERHIRMVMTNVVKSMNLEVVAEAKNGVEAIQMYREHRPHMVFMDINMPKMDGKEALKAIMNEFPKAFVIMVTSLSAMDIVTECLVIGASNYIRKDTSMDELKRCVKESWNDYVKSIK